MLRLCSLLLLFMVAAFPLRAQDVALSPEQMVLAQEVRTYLNSMKTLQGNFAQITSTGAYSDGKVYLSRPGKMRLIYNPPIKAEIIVRDGTIIYHDQEFRQVTYYPLNATPLAVLLQDTLSFDKDVRLMDVTKKTGVVEMTLEDREDAGMGSVTLVFSDAPLELRKWSVTDAQGIVTTVALLNPILGQTVDPVHFKFTDPEYDKKNN
jgi:outer membrane lipoprotein-sorting protein